MTFSLFFAHNGQHWQYLFLGLMSAVGGVHTFSILNINLHCQLDISFMLFCHIIRL
mgnify:FL=1